MMRQLPELPSPPSPHNRMSAVQRYVVLLVADAAGHVTASLVDDDMCAVGNSRQQAMQQLKDHLLAESKHAPWNVPAADMVEPEIYSIAVKVQPEYRMGERVFPLDDPVSLPVVAVRGRLGENGPQICALPLLGLRFYFHEEKSLKGLVTHYVQQAAKGMTPRELSRFLPPATRTLDQLVVPVRAGKRRGPQEDELGQLRQVAEAIGDSQVRKAWSAARERESEVGALITRLTKDRANVILLGEPGSGKSTVLADAVRQIERMPQADDPDALDDDADEPRARRAHRFWLTGGQRIISGMRWLGEWQERCDAMVEELGSIRGVLCIDSLLDLVQTGGDTPGASVAAYFMPYLQHGQLRMVVEATPAMLDACRRLLPGFAELFQVVRIDELTREQALRVFDWISQEFARNHRVDAATGVSGLLWRLFRRFMPYAAMPGKAIAFLGRLFDAARRDEVPEVTTDYLMRAFVRETGLPELFLRDDQPLPRADVVAALQREVIGQPAACEVAASTVTGFKAGLNDPARPIGVLLVAGPTGVGKTSLARALAKYFFGHGADSESGATQPTDRLVRIDMSEYGGPMAADRLLGRPDGTPGELVRRVREQPFCVVLLDEIEKGSPDVFDVLLGLLDEGRITDRYGRVTSFRSCVVILTSNLGASRAGAGGTIGYGTHSAATFDSEAARFFRPEFYNRIDEVVAFTPLSPEAIRTIAAKELKEMASREGLSARGLTLEWSDRLLAHVADAGFDPVYGARPLQRALEQSVIAPLARWLVKHPTVANQLLSLDLEAGELTVRQPT